MALYSVHLRGDGPEASGEAEFVPQEFSWKAFFFGPLWLARHGLWGFLLVWVAVYFALIVSALSVLSAGAAFDIALALQILLGLEANRLREAKLAALGYRLEAIIAAPSSDQAEAAFFRRLEGSRDTLADAGPGALLGTDS